MRRVGSTQVGPILGVSKWQNATDVFYDLVHGIRGGKKKVFERGNKYEPVMRETYRREVGPLGDAPCDRFHPMVHPQWNFASATPDGLTDELVVEFKTASVWAEKGWGLPLTDEVPATYLCQLVWTMAVADRPCAHLLVGFGQDDAAGNFHIVENRPFVVHRDFELELGLREVVERFWVDHVLTGVPPSEAPIGSIKRQVAKLKKEKVKNGSIERKLGEHFGRTSTAVEPGTGASPEGH